MELFLVADNGFIIDVKVVAEGKKRYEAHVMLAVFDSFQYLGANVYGGGNGCNVLTARPAQ
jgi:hypothetical protein